ncbi:hypothetical protein Glove_227g66 [Diversispora epigaea]|nr:hypothetical protein Glove_227g66 [Diversispora epigaea]
MYRCWSDDPSERPTADELSNFFCEISDKLYLNTVDNDIMRQLGIADQNQEKAFKSQSELFPYPNKHPQSCYISRCIHTLHGLHDSLDDIESGKSSDPNLLKSNELI